MNFWEFLDKNGSAVLLVCMPISLGIGFCFRCYGKLLLSMLPNEPEEEFEEEDEDEDEDEEELEEEDEEEPEEEA